MTGQKSDVRRRLLVRILVVAAVAGMGWAAGRTSSPKVTATVEAGRSSARTETRAGVPVDFADTEEGAASAVAAYQRAFASPSILRPTVLQERVEAVATPDYVAQMVAANTPGRDRIDAGPIGAGIAAGLQTLYSAVPIGYRIEAFTQQRAKILTWGFTLIGNASAVEPEAYFGLTHTELLWLEGSWRIASTRAGFGPTPKLATEPGPLGAYDVVGLAAHLTSYEPAA
jgi:hypothetical protein